MVKSDDFKMLCPQIQPVMSMALNMGFGGVKMGFGGV